MIARLVYAPLRRTGFSLVELLVVLTIAALLTVLAVPAWQRHAERSGRMQARADILSALLALERHALVTLSFAATSGGTTPAGEWPKPTPPPPARARHWLTATSCAGVDLSRCVEVRAAPVRHDALCGTLVLRSTGEWLSLPVADGDATSLPPEC